MSSVIRDFSQEAVANIRELIRENVDEEKQFFLWDWIDDSFKMDDLNIQDYLNDVSKYQSHMVDKHNINSKKFDRILERVKAVDVNYAKRFNEIYESVVSYNNKILKVTNMISPEGITLKSDVYDSVIDGIERIHNKDIDYLKYDLKDYDDELPVLRDIPWYEKALNAVGGTAVSLIRDNVEGLCFIPYAIVDGMFGTNLNERLQNCLDDAEEYLINNVVTDEQFYYYGKTVGNVVCMVEGAIFIANGLTTIAGGITLLGGGTALSSTGIGAIFGGPAIAVSLPAVAAGAIAISSGGGIMYSSMNNFEENLSKAQDAKTSKVDDVKIKDDIKELDGKIEKVDEGAGKASETIWDNIKITQHMYDGTKIPKSFELTANGEKFWVHPNGTKHMLEYITRESMSHGMPINSQTLLSSFQNSVSDAVKQGVKYDEIMNVGNWELIFSKPRGNGLLPVIKHAVYRP